MAPCSAAHRSIEMRVHSLPEPTLPFPLGGRPLDGHPAGREVGRRQPLPRTGAGVTGVGPRKRFFPPDSSVLVVRNGGDYIAVATDREFMVK